MASKKYSLLAGLLSLFAFSAAQAQTYRGAGYDVKDTSLIPSARIDQQRDFLNNNYDFPAKPRNQWEVGASLGLFNVSGDVRSKMPWNTVRGDAGGKKMFNAMGYSLQVRKAWGYIVSTRLQYLHGGATGFNWQQSQGYSDHNNPWNTNYNTAASKYGVVNYNYKTNVDELSLQMLVSLNNIKFHKARNKMGVYGLVGIGGMLYDTWNNALNASGGTYGTLFQTIADTLKTADNNGWSSSSNYKSDRKEINDMIRGKWNGVTGIDDTYESPAERHDNRPYFGSDRTYRTILTAGMGVSFRLGKRVSLNVEDKWSYTNDDLIDGQRWQEWPSPGNGGSALTRDFDTYNYASVGIGVNLGGRSVDPLWWMNPLDYQYNEIAKKSTPTINNCDKDSDGDGVSDCFDRCPDTPAGVAVDTKGCCLDTDGDGVCDYKDKQLITPTECQPVDADGVGSCPDPKCCENGGGDKCGSIASGMIMFAPASTKLDGAGMSQLSSLASQMKQNPQCKVVLQGNGNANKLEQQRSWTRTDACIKYLVNQGIDRDRIIFRFGGNNGNSSVSYMSASPSEMGGNTPPPPFPNLK